MVGGIIGGIKNTNGNANLINVYTENSTIIPVISVEYPESDSTLYKDVSLAYGYNQDATSSCRNVVFSGHLPSQVNPVKNNAGYSYTYFKKQLGSGVIDDPNSTSYRAFVFDQNDKRAKLPIANSASLELLLPKLNKLADETTGYIKWTELSGDEYIYPVPNL